MRKLSLMIAIFGTLMGAGITTASAQNYPFCVKGRDYPPGTGQCMFPSYAACQSFASGQFAYCDINPFYHGNQTSSQQKPPPSRRVYQGSY